MKFFGYILIVCAATSSSMVSADKDAEEYRLLKSWGLEFNAKGQLRFRESNAESSEYQSWKPELNRFLDEPRLKKNHVDIEPLIISSKPTKLTQTTPEH